MTYASGKWALGICDICGFECALNSMKAVIRDSQQTGLKACDDCWDPDHPQYKVGEVNTSDAIALKDPRPDVPRDPYTDTTLTPPIEDLFLNS